MCESNFRLFRQCVNLFHYDSVNGHPHEGVVICFRFIDCNSNIVFNISRLRNIKPILQGEHVTRMLLCMSPTLKREHGFVCSVHAFYRYLVWNMLSHADKIYSIEIPYLTTCPQTTNLMNTVLYSVWGHSRVKLDPNMIIVRRISLVRQRENAMSQIQKMREQCVTSLLLKQFQSFLLHTHPRLGEKSPANVLCIDVLESIYKQIRKVAE